MELVSFWKVFVNKFEKYLAYVRFDVFVEWWIKPNNVPFPVLSGKDLRFPIYVNKTFP